jgi:hypothetical protein
MQIIVDCKRRGNEQTVRNRLEPEAGGSDLGGREAGCTDLEHHGCAALCALCLLRWRVRFGEQADPGKRGDVSSYLQCGPWWAWIAFRSGNRFGTLYTSVRPVVELEDFVIGWALNAS